MPLEMVKARTASARGLTIRSMSGRIVKRDRVECRTNTVLFLHLDHPAITRRDWISCETEPHQRQHKHKFPSKQCTSEGQSSSEEFPTLLKESSIDHSPQHT